MHLIICMYGTLFWYLYGIQFCVTNKLRVYESRVFKQLECKLLSKLAFSISLPLTLSHTLLKFSKLQEDIESTNAIQWLVYHYQSETLYIRKTLYIPYHEGEGNIVEEQKVFKAKAERARLQRDAHTFAGNTHLWSISVLELYLFASLNGQSLALSCEPWHFNNYQWI